MAKRSKAYLWQFVIGLGFLSGVWTAVGIDPEEVILTTIGTTVTSVYSDPALHALFIILPTALLLISVYRAYHKGRALGLVSVLVAYVAGLSILLSLATTVILLCAAIILGYLATNRRLVKRLTGR